jgi:hypothetical protein
MAKKHTGNPAAEGRRAISFNGTTLTFFSTALVLAGALAGSGLFASLPWTNGGKSRGADALTTNSPTAPESAETPPWGDLLKTDIWVERPEEYVAIEAQTNQPPEWFFEKQSPDKARELMLSCGLSAAQVAHAMTPERVSATPSGTFVRPDDALVFSLPAETRAALYRQQPNNPSNRFISVPFTFQGEYVDEWMAGSGLDAAVLAQFKSLVYRRGPAYCFSDLEWMMRALPAAKQRLSFLKAVSRQPALLVRVRVRPSTDVDKVLGYWSRGTRAKDARPLLESLKRLPEGGSVSLLYLLPPFARDRLFTFPKPPAPNQPPMDCHWTSLNFFNETPDNRFADPSYVLQYMQSHYYPITKPTLCGDLVVILKNGTNAVHSAVYLADDIVFTKNGNNVHQPWTLMRMKDLMASYDAGDSPQFSFHRQNDR